VDRPPEHLDVLIVGAGLSGIGAGYHLQARCPGTTYAILEARDRSGGTWDLFRYPGIRSDSDMHTLGYAFRPWENPKAIADGPSILAYVRETASQHGIDRRIRFNHRLVAAHWSTADARWVVEAERTDTGEPVRLTCGFLFFCSGYYRYDRGFAPAFPGAEDFSGRIIHPQFWPDDLDYAGQRVVVIGSGATAVTIVPAMAEKAAHVTMLQRSPSYVVSLPARDELAVRLRRILGSRLGYQIIRWRNVLVQLLSFQVSRRRPELMKTMIRKGITRELPPGYDVDTHFTPPYNPWDQRMCVVPDGDLFAAIRSGRAEIVTDRIERFTATGVLLASGRRLETDIIVTATGLELVPLGGVTLSVDGRPIELGDTLGYKGMMLGGVPNMATAFGYTNASWTLKCDLTCQYVCRLLNHMRANGYAYCVADNDDASVVPEPFIDFSSGYVLRAIDRFPKQGSRRPWRLHQNYALDVASLRFARLDDGVLQFRRRSQQRDHQPGDENGRRTPNDDRRDQALVESVRMPDDE
jgi:monooxygenase